MNPYISAPKNLLYFSLFFLTGGLDPGDQICLCRADFLLYREENATLVLAVVLLRIGCIAVACIIRAVGLAVLLIVAIPLTFPLPLFPEFPFPLFPLPELSLLFPLPLPELPFRSSSVWRL